MKSLAVAMLLCSASVLAQTAPSQSASAPRWLGKPKAHAVEASAPASSVDPCVITVDSTKQAVKRCRSSGK